MSLDYPFYQELQRRGHPAAKWWRVGDALYYLGLLPALFLAIPSVIALIEMPFGYARWQLWVLVLFVFFAVIFLLATRLKLKSWNMAGKDGINVNDF
jgi:hypothetical protein